MLFPTYDEPIPYVMGEICCRSSQKVDKDTPIPLIQWRHLYNVTYRRNWNFKTNIIYTDVPTLLPPRSNEKWDGIGLLFGGGKESLLTLCMLSEFTQRKVPIHVIVMGVESNGENRELISRLEIFKKMGMNIVVHSGCLNGNETWGHFISAIPLCAKYKIGNLFYGSEVDMNSINEVTNEVTQYYCCGVEIFKFATKAMHDCGWPITLTSLVSPLTGINAMHILHKRYPEYAKYMMSYLPNSSMNSKKLRMMLYAEALGLTIDSEQNDVIYKVKNGMMDDWIIRGSTIPKITTVTVYCHELKHALYRLNIFPQFAKENNWFESPVIEYKQYLHPDFMGAWDIFKQESMRPPVHARKVVGDITVSPLYMSEMFKKALLNIKL